PTSLSTVSRPNRQPWTNGCPAFRVTSCSRSSSTVTPVAVSWYWTRSTSASTTPTTPTPTRSLPQWYPTCAWVPPGTTTAPRCRPSSASTTCSTRTIFPTCVP